MSSADIEKLRHRLAATESRAEIGKICKQASRMIKGRGEEIVELCRAKVAKLPRARPGRAPAEGSTPSIQMRITAWKVEDRKWGVRVREITAVG